MGWTLFFMFFVLKIPIAALLYIVWYAVKSPPEPETKDDHSGGGGPRSKRPHPLPPRPRRPRRGPHGEPALPPPPRVRHVIARAREVER